MKIAVYDLKNSVYPWGLAIAAGILLLASCQKNATITLPPSGAMNNEEAVALLESALAADAGGLKAELETAIDVAQLLLLANAINPNCETTMDSMLARSFNDSRFTGNQSANLQWILNCQDPGTPNTLVYSWYGNLHCESLKMISDDYSDGTLVMANLSEGTAYLFSGSYERTGTQQSKVRDRTYFASSCMFTFTDLSVDRGNLQINSGAANFMISGSVIKGQSFFINGDIIFPGGGAAEVTLNGLTYSLQLN